ncbi:MAG: CYTH domain-containing protein [Bacilli bacterium]|nr:CYTH domain-containing protein [Bacilli bacterium]
MKVNDNISFEYEERSMLSKTDYDVLVSDYSKLTNDKLSITNIYFDTKDLILTKSGMVLRLRNSNGQLEITLKIKDKHFDKEINHPISSFSDNILPLNKPILNELKQLNVNISDILEVGKIKTNRIEIKMNESLIVLDQNEFLNTIDYNIEIESSSREKAKLLLQEIANKYKFEITKNYISKSRRVIYSCNQ